MDPYDPDQLAELLRDQPSYRLAQVRGWLVRGVDDPAQMTDLPQGLRQRLADAFDPPPEILRHSTADGGLTHKVLLRMGGGEATSASGSASGAGRAGAGEAVESVLMLYPRTEARDGRATVCISTQAGCAMGCPFCATGQAGYRGQLGLGEVLRQVTVMQRMLADGTIAGPDVPGHVTNVVFMGMGEPLANLDVTVDAVRWLHDPDGFNLSARSITVSTVGLVPGIRRLTRLAREERSRGAGLAITLAVSLHAPDDALRDDLVPVNRQHPIAEVLDACREYLAVTGRRLTFEYILIDGVNSSVAQARQLAALVKGLTAHVNLIPMNATPAVPWTAPPVPAQRAFLEVLERAGVPATIRANRGGDIDAACGQLYADYAVASGAMLPGAAGAAQRVGLRLAGPAGMSAE